MTYTSYKEQFKLYAENHGLTIVNSCQIELARKDIILISEAVVVLYGIGLRTVIKDRHIKCTLSKGTHFIDDFNAKIKAAVLQQKQNWSALQIKKLQLVMPEHNTFMASNSFFIALRILDNYLEKTKQVHFTP